MMEEEESEDVGCVRCVEGVPAGPITLAFQSMMLSPFGPAVMFAGGSSEISANSFCILYNNHTHNTIHNNPQR